MIPVHIAGVGMTQFGKSPESLIRLLREAGMRALANSPVHDIDAIYVAVMNPEEFTGEGNIAAHVAESLGMTGIPAVRVETASSAGAAALHAAFQGIASGYYRHVLVIGGEKMTHLSTSSSTKILAEVIDDQERHCGATMPALAAMVTAKYRRKHHLSESRLERVLCAIAMKNHQNGVHNPYAQFREAITKDKYLASKWVATPLRLYDCAPMTDGAAAVVLTAVRTDLAVSGIGQGTGPVSLRARASLTAFPATQIAAAKAYQMAGLSPQQIDCAEVHDAFTPFEIIGSEDLGFFRHGKGGQAALSGQTAVDGKLPINASGGLKSRGHPVGASGVAQVVELARMLRGESGANLKREPRRALAQSIGGLASNNFVTIIERTQDPMAILAAPTPRARRDFGAVSVSGEASLAAMPSDGTIDTFTILHTTPDGLLPPLALALIRDPKGSLVMAQGEDINHIKIGREVYLHQAAGIVYFTVKNQLQLVREAMGRLLHRRARQAKLPQSLEAQR